MKRYFTIGLLLCGGLLTSCNHWLDLEPYGTVEADKMFEDEAGFIQTLTGSYLLMTDPAAYGYELTAGFPDEIVHYYNERSEFYNFNYESVDAEGRLEATWLQMYEAIANTNLLLQNLEGRNPDEFDHYNLILGEALGLRAYLHLDLLRLFGPVLRDGGMEREAIPYHEEFSNRTVQLMTAAEVLERIHRDLDSAYVLLADDPIKTYGRRETSVNAGVPQVNGLAYSFRGCRMNYYAVCATLARVCMLEGDYANAARYANEVIDSEIFSLVQTEDVGGAENEKNRMFERELVWALFDSQTGEDSHLGLLDQDRSYALDDAYRTYVYMDNHSYGSEEDFRCQYWFGYASELINSWYYVSKYGRIMSETGDTDETPWETVVPMIRLTEMYYIAAEASLETNPAEAYRLLNEVRASRNIPTTLPQTVENNADELMNQIVYECQKDFWGEGKLFYLYKRLFMNIRTNNENIPATRELFELPIPDDEIEFGDNNN